MSDPGVISGIKIVRRKFVQLPLEPTPEILAYLSDRPVICSWSEEDQMRQWYAKLLEIGGMKK